jgi:AAA domain
MTSLDDQHDDDQQRPEPFSTIAEEAWYQDLQAGVEEPEPKAPPLTIDGIRRRRAERDAESLEDIKAEVVDGMPAPIFEPRPIPLVDLIEVMRDGVPPPTFIADDHLYAGQLHSLAGEPDAGKTTLAFWWMLQTMRAGRPVLLIDEEGGRENTAVKLVELGGQPEEMAGLLHYIEYPGRTWDAHDLTALDDHVATIRPALVVFDSMAAVLAAGGRDENSAQDVTEFTSRVLLPLARHHGAAVLYLDHVTKDGNGGRYARGSGAKLASVDVAYTLDLVTPFSRSQDGRIKLKVKKDRRGHLHREHEIKVLTGELLRLEFTRKAASGARGLEGLSRMKQRVLAQLKAGGPAQTVKHVHEGVAADGLGTAAYGTVSNVLKELEELALARPDEHGGRQSGRFPDRYWSLTEGGEQFLPFMDGDVQAAHEAT